MVAPELESRQLRCEVASQCRAGAVAQLAHTSIKECLIISQRKSRGQEAIQLALAQPIVAPEGHQLFLLFVDGGPQPPRPTTAWKLAAPDQIMTDAVEISAHIDGMMRQGVQQRVVSAGGSMMSIDLRMFTVTNLSRGVAFRLIPEKSLQSVPPRPYKYESNRIFWPCFHIYLQGMVRHGKLHALQRARCTRERFSLRSLRTSVRHREIQILPAKTYAAASLQQHPTYKFHTATRHTAFFGRAGVLRRAAAAARHAV